MKVGVLVGTIALKERCALTQVGAERRPGVVCITQQKRRIHALVAKKVFFHAPG